MNGLVGETSEESAVLLLMSAPNSDRQRAKVVQSCPCEGSLKGVSAALWQGRHDWWLRFGTEILAMLALAPGASYRCTDTGYPVLLTQLVHYAILSLM